MGLAGCSGVTSQSFEAEPVRLPTEDREELNLPETSFDSATTTRDPPVVDGEITITTHVVAYRRGGE